MGSEELIQLAERHIMQTYKRFPLVLVKGSGLKVWDSSGREYLDMVGGIAVCNLGHCHPAVVTAINEQSQKLFHVSNLYYIEPQINLARLMTEHSFADKVFFCNSGAEANEAAIKLARKYSHENFKGEKYELITMFNSFHGRTLATVAATGQEKFHRGFEPLPAGFKYVPYNDTEAVVNAITEKTCGILVEPIQGEGGVIIPDENYLREIRRICDRMEILMILDEVQVGMGRTGSLFAYEKSGIKPDILTLAKALGNGFPIGAMLATDRIAASFVPGSHASTFGGNPLAAAAACAVMKTLLNGDVLENCREMGTILLQMLMHLKDKYETITDVRGQGLMVAVELSIPGDKIVNRCLAKGLLINCTNANVLRFVPPLVINAQEVEQAVKILDEVISEQ